jgi:RNA-dependent RNA polymerase
VILDLKRRELAVFFQLAVYNRHRPPKDDKDYFHDYRLRVPFAQLSRIYQTWNPAISCHSHYIVLETPPIYHRRLKDLTSTFSESDASWRDADTWYRQTDIVHVPEELAGLAIGLRKHKPIINIGRWTTIRINYASEAAHSKSFATLCRVLRDFNIDIQEGQQFETNLPNKSPLPLIWEVIDPPTDSSRGEAKQKTSLIDDYMASEKYLELPFSVRYQLEVCLSNGNLSEYAAGREFVEKLLELGERKARLLLEHVSTEKKIYYDPMAIFNIQFAKTTSRGKLPSYCCLMRSATVTPSTVYYSTPSVEISNRVIRHFIEYSDRFLRVRFKDEKLEGRINSTERNTMDEVFTRVKRAMSNGIVLGDRHYEFLAFGNSQFREHGAFFFASLPNLTAANIRGWMGQFQDIRNIAKYAARLGQCFSTTRAITACSVQVREIKDVMHNGHTFSDGVGRISKFLAQMTTSELNIKTPDGEPPSAFQFRLGGSKGMLVVSSEARSQQVHIRPSQHKFPADHNGLEIIRWSQFSMASLNRQIIIVLSHLGVPDQVFHSKLRKMLANLDDAMTNEREAMNLLQKYIDPNQMTLTISQMVSDGFQKSMEPFVSSLLALWRSWQIKYLKEKAKIVIDGGACLLGVMDETATLKGFSREKTNSVLQGAGSNEEKLDALPEIFVQIYSADERRYRIIEGVCILARNPSLHPGDIRVVKAVNVPHLNHLKDVVVLPQLGDRDISSMCSGGDLDGDDYLVIWDEDLVPRDWFRAPMDYPSVKGLELDRPVTVNDVTSFFVMYMKNDCLPRIAHAHLAWADFLPDGVEDTKCIRLAQLHSDAVDYNKTGNPARMTRDLQPRKWPHFMEKNYKPKDCIYKSNKILGQLYDAVDRVDFVPSFEMPFDDRVLNSGIIVKTELMTFAKKLKVSYDLAVRRIMAQHEIKTEFEVWSTFVLSHANMSKDYKFHEELGGISKSLRDRFCQECYDQVGSRNFEKLAPLVVAMYKVTSDEVTTALTEFRTINPINPINGYRPKPNPNRFPLISFPWLFPDVLGRIALCYFDEKDEELVGSSVTPEAQDEHTPSKTNVFPDDRNDVQMHDSDQPSELNISQDYDTGFKLQVNLPIRSKQEVIEKCKPASLPVEMEEEEDMDIVEENGDLQPSAINVLQNMLDSSDDDDDE